MCFLNPSRHDSVHIRRRRLSLALTREFAILDFILYGGMTLAEDADCLAGVVRVLARDQDSHIDDGNPCRVLVGLANSLHSPAEEL